MYQTQIYENPPLSILICLIIHRYVISYEDPLAYDVLKIRALDVMGILT